MEKEITARVMEVARYAPPYLPSSSLATCVLDWAAPAPELAALPSPLLLLLEEESSEAEPSLRVRA